MSFLAFKISEYNHTAEREQYRKVCKLLKAKYAKADDLCVFIANYNIYDCELDGIILKPDAIIGVEFKNYGGALTAVENGQWTLSDETVVKGGSGKSVYQQAKVNHVAIKRGLKECRALPPKMLKHIPALVVFARPITLDNRLSEKVQSWLHVCDITRFIAKIEDITNPQFYLSTEQIVAVLSRLGLCDDFIDGRFSTETSIINKPTEQLDPALTELTPTTPEPATAVAAVTEDTDTDNRKKACERFLADEVFPAIGLADRFEVNVVRFSDFENVINRPLPFHSEYVAILQTQNASALAPRLQRLFNKEVTVLSDEVICWGEGEFEAPAHAESVPAAMPVSVLPRQSQPQRPETQAVADESITLPAWLDDCIYRELDARFQPAFDRFTYNLDLDRDESRIYLGTYFPRSFAEARTLFDALLRDESYLSILRAKERLKVLDFGSGSGGELFGLLESIDSHCPSGMEVDIRAVDGNQHSLLVLESIMSRYVSRDKSRVQLEIIPANIQSDSDFTMLHEFLSSEYDLIIASKSLGEFQRRIASSGNAYEHFANHFAPMLSENGLLIITDVTIKDEQSGWFLPQLMNVGLNRFIASHPAEFKTLVPCAQSDTPAECRKLCFHKHEARVCHSSKQNDHSKFTLRIISRQGWQADVSHLRDVFHNSECMYN